MKISEKLKKISFWCIEGPNGSLEKVDFARKGGFVCLRKKIQFTGCSQASLNMRKDLLEGIRWLIIVFAPLPVSTPARPFGVGGCGDWEGGLYKKGPRGVCLSFLI